MSISKHIYYADSKYPRTVILSHGGSETQVLSDSDEDKPISSSLYKKMWMSREGWIPEKKEEKSWLSEALIRARRNGDL